MFSIKRSIPGLLILLSIVPVNAQDKKEEDENLHPYKLCLKADIPITALGIGGTAYGFVLRESKTSYDSSYVMSLDVSQLSKYNRDATRQNSKSASLISDFLIAGGFIFPVVLGFDKSVRSDLGTVSLMYLETMALTGMGYWLSAGLVDKARPYVYNKNIPLERRTNKHSKDSFYGGHCSVTAAGTFFVAQVYSDYHPESKFKYVLWSFAGVATLANAYARYKGGYHFPSDIVIGVGVGTAIGILVPVLHRKSKKINNLSFAPVFNKNISGIYVKYYLPNL